MILRCLPLQIPEHEKADHNGSQRAARRCNSHREEGVREPERGQIDARDADEHDGDDVVQEGKFRPSAGAEVTAEGKVDSRKNTVPDIPADVLAAEPCNFRICCKQTDNRNGNKLHGNRDNQPESDRDHDSAPHGLFCALFLSGTNIMCAECRDG